jgi:ribonucleoside-diphosphate reductase alpha chain
MLTEDGKGFMLIDYALDFWRTMTGTTTGAPGGFETVGEILVSAHLDMQATLQPFVDNSISKTINVSQAAPSEDAAGAAAPHRCVPQREPD